MIFHWFLPDSQCSLCLLGLGCPNWLHLFDQFKGMCIGKQWWHQGEGVHILSPRAANAIVRSVDPHAPSASSFPSVFPQCPFPGCWHLVLNNANSPGFPPGLLLGGAAGMLCWGSQRWISRCFSQIPLATPVSLLHMIQLMESNTAWVEEISGLFFLVLLGV